MSSATEQFTGTRAMSASHAFDVPALERWLTSNVSGFAGPLTVEQFKGGQSNPTYKLLTPARAYVMRSKPGPVARLLPSAHAIEREYRVMSALAGTAVPVPAMLALCEDEGVIGRAFYVMDCVEGRVLWEQGLPEQTPDERRAIYDEMNRVIAALHALDPAALGLADYGKPGSYFERQIGRWSKQYQAAITEPIPEMEKLMQWLPERLPASARDDALVSVVHGDYRLDNLIFDAAEPPSMPRIRAVLDWELSTLGHPLADFSYHCMSWHIPPGMFRGLAGLDLAALGIPSERAYVERYCARSGGRFEADTVMRDWNFYLAYNMFRLASIMQGIARRVVDGTASSAQAKASGAAARPLAQMAWRAAQQA
jgi:aminoglycoside phosphotransferase (APT) family kinase protein